MQTAAVLRMLLMAAWSFSSATAIVRFGTYQSTVEENPQHRQLRSLVHDVKRARVITLPESRPAVAVGELIEFELFDGKVAVGDVTNLVTRSAGEVTWMGNIRLSTGNQEADVKVNEGDFALTCVEKSCIANLQFFAANAHFRITPANTVLDKHGHGHYALSEIHLNDEKRTGVNVTAIMMAEAEKKKKKELSLSSIQLDAVSPSAVPTVKPSAAPTVQPDSDLIMDILVLFTPDAVRNNFGGR